MRKKIKHMPNTIINFEAKCDLCGNIFTPVLIFGEDKDRAYCDNCDNYTCFDRNYVL